MSTASKWFEQPIVEEKKKSNHANNWPFQMEKDEELRICILNPDDERIPPVHYHNIFTDNKVNRVLCTAAKHLGGSCPFCDYTAEQDEASQWRTELRQEYAYTILVDKYDGKEPKKCLRLSTVSDHQNIQRLRETAINKMDKSGLQYVWIEVARPSTVDKAPRIGKVGQILSDLDKSKYSEDLLTPFTQDEILVQFVADETESEAIYQSLVGGGGKAKPKVRKVN